MMKRTDTLPGSASDAPAAGCVNQTDATRLKSISQDKSLTTNGADASDGSHAALEQDLENPSDEVPEKIDPFVEEYGPLIVKEEDDVFVNQIAVAAKLTSEHRITFHERASTFRQYTPATGLWELLNDAKAKLKLGAFLKILAEQLDAPDLILKRTNAMLTAILNLARGISIMGERPADSGSTVHVSNGVIEVSATSATLREFRPEDWATSACAIPYNGKAKCERFLEELLKPALTPESFLYRETPPRSPMPQHQTRLETSARDNVK